MFWWALQDPAQLPMPSWMLKDEEDSKVDPSMVDVKEEHEENQEPLKDVDSPDGEDSTSKAKASPSRKKRRENADPAVHLEAGGEGQGGKGCFVVFNRITTCLF